VRDETSRIVFAFSQDSFNQLLIAGKLGVMLDFWKANL